MPVYTEPIVIGELIRRPNRFRADVLLTAPPEAEGDGTAAETPVFVPNPGRMHELMVPGYRVACAWRPTATRKTAWDMVAVWYADTWVGVDTRMPNALLAEGLSSGVITSFGQAEVERAEFTWGASRFDFLLRDGEQPILVEVKSCNLVEDGQGLFPDAPTKRGARHMLELIDALEEGYRCAVCFIVQRGDCRVLRPFAERDPDFTEALSRAAAAGVQVVAWGCDTAVDSITVSHEVVVELP